MIFGLGSSFGGRLDARRNARSFAIRSSFDGWTKQKLQWEAVHGGKRLDAEPEPMVEYQGRFPDFCREILKVEPWAKQEEIGSAVDQHERVSVAACYASGKTFTAACLVLYWLFTRRPAIVVTTAPTGRQVKGLLWREVRKLYKRCAKALKGKLLQARLEFADDWQGFGFSTSGDNQASGFHESENVFFIIDEAAGISQESFEDFDGITATPNSRMLLIGNPICTSGPFYDSHMDPRIAADYVKIQISALDTPNYQARKVVVKGLCEYEWVERRRRLWGVSSPLWRVKVLGQFIALAMDQVVPTQWVKDAQRRWVEMGGRDAAEGRRVMGLDVAGGGRDETVAYLKHGRFLWRIGRTQEGNHDTLFRWVLDLAKEHEVDSIYIDATMISKGLADRLGAQSGEDEFGNPGELGQVEVIKVYSNEGPNEPEHYADRATEICFSMRHALDPEHPGALAIDPDDDDLLRELPVRRWVFDRRNLVKAESKTDLRKRKVESPDCGDAANLTTLQMELIAA